MLQNTSDPLPNSGQMETMCDARESEVYEDGRMTPVGVTRAGAMQGLAAMGPRVVRLLLVPQVPAYSALLDKALCGGRPGSVRRMEAQRLQCALLSAFCRSWSVPAICPLPESQVTCSLVTDADSTPQRVDTVRPSGSARCGP